MPLRHPDLQTSFYAERIPETTRPDVRDMQSASAPLPAPSIRWVRTLSIGLALMILNCYLVFWAEAVRFVQLSNAAPFANVIFLLAVVMGVNAILAQIAPHHALRIPELVILYVMLAVETAISSARFVVWILYAVTYGTWFDTPQRNWHEQYVRYLPTWLTVQNREVLRGFYLGESTLFTPAHISAWLLPLLFWGLFICVLGAVLLAIGTLFSKQWIHRERLTYPVVELPFQMVSGGAPFWRNRLMWFGFAIAATIELVNGLHFWFPSIPYIPTKRTNLAVYFSGPPLNALTTCNLSFYPFIIGLGFLMPLDLAFSVTFFVLVFYASFVFGKITALDGVPNYPFVHEQEFGAALAILFTLLLSSRTHLNEIVRMAFTAPAGGRRTEEAALYRRSLLTLIFGTFFLVGFLIMAGLSWWIAGVFIMVYCALGLIVARMRAELGLPTHMLVGLTGSHMLMSTVGNETVGVRNVPLMAILGSFTYYNSNHMLPYQMEGLRMADRERIRSRVLSHAVLVAIGVGVVVTLITQLDSIYRVGGATKMFGCLDQSRYTWEHIMSAWMSGGAGTLYRKPQWTSLAVMVSGFFFCLFLMALRHRFLWFPLHPVGLLMGYTAEDVWTGVALAMVIKWLVLRYSGLRGYRMFVPFFLGLALGDMVSGMSWIVFSILFQTPIYVFFL